MPRRIKRCRKCGQYPFKPRKVQFRKKLLKAQSLDNPKKFYYWWSWGNPLWICSSCLWMHLGTWRYAK